MWKLCILSRIQSAKRMVETLRGQTWELGGSVMFPASWGSTNLKRPFWDASGVKRQKTWFGNPNLFRPLLLLFLVPFLKSHKIIWRWGRSAAFLLAWITSFCPDVWRIFPALFFGPPKLRRQKITDLFFGGAKGCTNQRLGCPTELVC